jgi:putative two-component system response regulator
MILEGAGYKNILAATDPLVAIDIFTARHPDLVITDLHMPGIDGFTLMGRLRDLAGGAMVPMIAVTGDDSSITKTRALRAGASDYLTKPFDPIEITLRVKNLLELKRLHSRLERRNRSLDQRVKERTMELEAARIEILDRLAIAAEYRDDDTGQHARRVGASAGSIARTLGLPKARVQLITRAATLHDLGKIGIPDTILLKPGPLDDAEFEVIKQHTRIGAEILSGSQGQLLGMAEVIALHHHERWDGSGYEGLVEEQIPLEGRIVALADAFDAMTNDRPYRPARDRKEAIEEVVALAGAQFDPTLVDAFMGSQIRDGSHFGTTAISA